MNKDLLNKDDAAENLFVRFETAIFFILPLWVLINRACLNFLFYPNVSMAYYHLLSFVTVAKS